MPGAAPYAAPPPPEKSSRRTLWIVLGVVGGILIVGAILLAIGAAFLFNTVTAPVDSVNEYLGALQEEDYATAYDLLCEDQQSLLTEDEFEETTQAGFDEVGSIEEFDANEVDVSGDDATVGYSLKTSERDGDIRIQAGLVKEDGDWKLCTFGNE